MAEIFYTKNLNKLKYSFKLSHYCFLLISNFTQKYKTKFSNRLFFTVIILHIDLTYL